MKKLFIIISASFVFLLSCIIPFTASADASQDDIIEIYFTFNSNAVRDDNNFYYVGLTVSVTAWDGSIYYNDVVLEISKNNCTVTNSDDILSITDNSNTGIPAHIQRNDSHNQTWGYTASFKSVVIDSINENITAVSTANSTYYDHVSFSNYSDTMNIDNTCPLVFTFAPELSGNVDRSYTVGGVTYYSDTLIMGVTNNSGYNWAYDFTIYDSLGNIIYQFLSYEWENTFDLAADNISVHNMLDQSDCKIQLIGSDWHLVQGGSSVVQRFKWTQIPLKTGETYTLECYAYKCGTGEYLNNVMLSDFHQNRPEAVDNPIDDYFNEKSVLAYSSTFKMLNYDDIVYDHNDTSNGIIPYSSSEDYYKARTSRLATDDGNGNIDYKNYSAYDDPNSWYNKNSVSSSLDAIKRITEDSKSGKRNFYYEYSSGSVDGVSGSGNSNFSALVANSSGFLTLCKNVFRYFPDWLTTLFFGGMLCIVLVAIWRKI